VSVIRGDIDDTRSVLGIGLVVFALVGLGGLFLALPDPAGPVAPVAVHGSNR
jgi:hypothetical protein